MLWPQSQEYNEAIQNPKTCFKDPELKAGEAVTNALGMPIPCSGNFADVYQVQGGNNKGKWAVKCFTRGEPASLRQRYAHIDKHLQQAKHIQQPQHDENYDDGIKDGLNCVLHGYQVDQPQKHPNDNENQDDIQ